MSNLLVYKSNKVIEASYRLSLNEQKIIIACIAKHDSAKPLQVADTFRITANEFAELTGVDMNNAYRALKDAAENLFKREVVIENPDPERPKLKKTKTRWISSIDYITDDATLELHFAPRMLPYLGQLKSQFTKYELRYIGGLKSKWGIRLYELLAQYRGIGRREFQITWLREHFEIEQDEYSVINDFKKRVITAAIDDINAHSDLKVHEPIYTKTGRKVTGVTFDFKEKQKAKPQQSKQATKPTQAAPIDNVEHYANLLKRAGGDARQAIIDTMPIEVKQALMKNELS